jgi:uncharacterized membrane protein YfcA
VELGAGQIVLIVIGALAGGIVNGLTGFGTALTALGIWLFALPPTVAATLVILSSVVSQLQTLPMIWRTILWKRVVAFVAPGVLGVPIGTFLLPHIDPRLFKIGVGVFLVLYSAHVLARRFEVKTAGGVDRYPWLEQGSAARGLADVQHGDFIVCLGLACGIGTAHAGGRRGGAHRIAGNDCRRAFRRLHLSPPRRSQLSARDHGAVDDLGRRADLVRALDHARLEMRNGPDQ